ncbi:Trypsin [Popillia japonica]|uniref:Trypsin n=1 Tax=Popillia japonica TaxID=7064 RepID=A0AAW1L4V3_POPJA
MLKQLQLFYLLAVAHFAASANMEELYATQGGIEGITKSLKVDGLPDPYEIDLSALNMTNNFFEGKESKVIGGVEVPMHYFPFQAALYIYFNDGSNTFCGSSLISQNYVLTAAHCVTNPYHILVVLGAFDLSRNEPTQLRLYATKYTYHAQWSSNTIKNDIALIRLPTPVKFSVAIRPVTLPTYEDSRYGFEEVNVMVVGWGKTSDYSETSTRLRYVESKVVPNEACTSYFPSITYAQICVGSNTIVGPCNGDSGGPLVYGAKQLGIVSFGSRSCTTGSPSIFTRVSTYLRWIAAHSDVTVKSGNH